MKANGGVTSEACIGCEASVVDTDVTLVIRYIRCDHTRNNWNRCQQENRDRYYTQHLSQMN